MEREIPIADETLLDEALRADRAVLILAKTTSASVDAYVRDLQETVLPNPKYQDVRFAIVHLDDAPGDELRLNHAWANNLEFLPFTVLLAKGQKVDGFGASVGKYLALRMEKRFFAAPRLAA